MSATLTARQTADATRHGLKWSVAPARRGYTWTVTVAPHGDTVATGPARTEQDAHDAAVAYVADYVGGF